MNILRNKKVSLTIISILVIIIILMIFMVFKKPDNFMGGTSKYLSEEIPYNPSEIEQKALDFQAKYEGDLIRYSSDKKIDFAVSRLGLLKEFKDCEESLKHNNCEKRIHDLFKQIKNLKDTGYSIDDNSYVAFTSFIGLYGIKSESLKKLFIDSGVDEFKSYYEKYKLQGLEQSLLIFFQDPNMLMSKVSCKQFVSLDCENLYYSENKGSCQTIKQKCLSN